MWKQQQGRLRNKDTYLFPFQMLLTFITMMNANIINFSKQRSYNKGKLRRKIMVV